MYVNLTAICASMEACGVALAPSTSSKYIGDCLVVYNVATFYISI